MQYRINDKGHVYRVAIENNEHLKNIGLDVSEVTLLINEFGLYVDKENDITVSLVNDGSF